MARVMIVDDSLFMRNHVAKVLNQYGYDAVMAESGEEALGLYRQAAPDVVLMDITMPGKDGLETLIEICRFDPAARVIMLTALGQTAAANQAMRDGAKDFLVKPVSPETLYAALQKVLGVF